MSSDSNNSREPSWERFKDRGEFVFAAVLTIYGVAGYYVVHDQLAVMRQQTADARKMAVDSDKVTERQLKIAESQAASLAKLAGASKVSADNSDRIARGSEDTVKGAHATARLDQRAWIGISNISGKPVVGEPLAIVVEFHNSGRTPAMETNTIALVAVADRGKHPIFGPARAAKVNVTSRGLLPPNGAYKVTGTLYSSSTMQPYVLTAADMTAVDNGDVTLYIHAMMRYRDIFKQPHWSMACYRYNPKRDGDQYDACDWGNLVDIGGEPPPPPPY